MKLGIRAQLFLFSLVLVLVPLLGMYLYARTELGRTIVEGIRTDLLVRTRLAGAHCELLDQPYSDTAAWQKAARDLSLKVESRVTIIAVDGRVVADSAVEDAEIPTIPNHANRPEVVAALAGQLGEDAHLSETLGQERRYAGVAIRKHGRVVGVVRLSVPMVALEAARQRLNTMLSVGAIVTLLICLALATIGAQVASRRVRALTAVAARMAEGDLLVPPDAEAADEFGALSRSLSTLSRNLSRTLGELREERDRLGGILSGMQEGVLMLDGGSRVALINPALRRMLLLSTDAIGKPPLEVIRHAELKELLDEARTAGEARTAEIDLDGIKPRRVTVWASPLPGDQAGLFAVFFDVTEMRKLETMRRDFVANVSHELRTPVTAIRSAAETLGTALVDDPAAAPMFAGIIDRNASRLQELIEDLLDLSRIESREYRLSPEDLDLEQVTDHVLGLFEERAQKRDISLTSGLQSPTTIRADRRAFEHVLTNLVDNAVKYCPAGASVRVEVEVAGTRLLVRVVDNGTGIDARHMGRLFERFYRVDAGRSRDVGGTGLGLSIVKHLVEAMGGDVGVDSTLGEGSTFWFSLPKADAPRPSRR